MPEGYTLVDGQCVVIPPPVDKCLNIAGNQATVPEGYFAIGKLCFPVPPPPPTYTVCYKGETLTGLNLVQKIYYLLHGVKLAERLPPPPVDVCPNIEGNQSEVPDGMVKDEQGNCVTPTAAPDRRLPEHRGQPGVRAGWSREGRARQLRNADVSPPPTVKSDEFMDVQVIKDATPQVAARQRTGGHHLHGAGAEQRPEPGAQRRRRTRRRAGSRSSRSRSSR